MPCQALLVTIRTYSRHFKSLYIVWWNWGFAPSENKFAKTINLQWSYLIHQRFLFSPYVYLVPVHLFVCLLSVSSCLWEWNFSFEDSFAWMFAFVYLFLGWEYSSILFKRRDFVFVFGYMHPLPKDCVLLHHLAPKVGRVCHLEIYTFAHLAEKCVLHLTLIGTLQINIII